MTEKKWYLKKLQFSIDGVANWVDVAVTDPVTEEEGEAEKV